MGKEDQERKIRMQRNMAGHDCSLARAFAVNPSRLPARPSGLRGVDRSARPSRGAAVPSMQTCVRVSLLKRTEGRNVDHEKTLDSRSLRQQKPRPLARPGLFETMTGM